MNLKQEQEQMEQGEEEHEGTQVLLSLGQLEEALFLGFYRGEEPHGRPSPPWPQNFSGFYDHLNACPNTPKLIDCM